MIDISNILLIVLAVIVLTVCVLWFVVPLATGLPWVPSHEKRIRKALQMAGLQPGERLYDLGAGDGRVLVIAAREFGAFAVGIEISPVHCLIAWFRALFYGMSRQISIRCSSFFSTRIEEADVVFAYVTPGHASRLRPFLERQLKNGARVVTLSAEIEGWQPDDIDSSELVFLYYIPPTSGSIATYLSAKVIK